jgi:hypothetical protein
MLTGVCWMGDRSSDVLMLVDCGADNLVLPAETLDYLGVSLDEVQAMRARTPYGPQDGFLGPEVLFTLPDLDPSWGFTCQPIFSPMFDGLGYGLLGRDPSFEHFRCAFDHRLGEGTLMTLY